MLTYVCDAIDISTFTHVLSFNGFFHIYSFCRICYVYGFLWLFQTVLLYIIMKLNTNLSFFRYINLFETTLVALISRLELKLDQSPLNG